jgi:hypothetical protein
MGCQSTRVGRARGQWGDNPDGLALYAKYRLSGQEEESANGSAQMRLRPKAERRLENGTLLYCTNE